MSTILQYAQNGQIREVMESIDLEAEKKLEATLVEAVEEAKNRALSPGTIDNVYSVADEIALEAFEKLKKWALTTYTASPAKDIAQAWVNTSAYRFRGPVSIQKQIRQILTAK